MRFFLTAVKIIDHFESSVMVEFPFFVWVDCFWHVVCQTGTHQVTYLHTQIDTANAPSLGDILVAHTHILKSECFSILANAITFNVFRLQSSSKHAHLGLGRRNRRICVILWGGYKGGKGKPKHTRTVKRMASKIQTRLGTMHCYYRVV